MSKPPLFYVGQHVTPIAASIDYLEQGCSLRWRMGEVYEVNWVAWVKKQPCGNEAGWHIGCVEWPQDECVHERLLAPVNLLPDEALAELLSETLEPVTA